MGEYATISMNAERARPILRGEEQVMLRDDILATRVTARAAERKGRPAAEHEALDGDAATLFDALRLWRSGEAKAQSVPPYVIFHDTVLREVAAIKPVNEDELGQIKGVGASKLARYGAGVLAVVRDRA
jgi:ATP-dependent DNA helicase RecQ